MIVETALMGLGQAARSMPAAQIAAFALAIGVWLVGGELLFSWHHRRRGRSWAREYSWFSLPLKDFDALEWSVGLLIVLITLMLNQAAFALGR
jgi:hypothetical protein